MKPLIRSTLLSVSLLLFIPKRTVQACGFWVYPGQYRFWLLQPDLTNEQDLTPFYFAASYLYHGDMNVRTETWPDQNINEWFTALKGRVSKNDIDSFLNHTSPQDFFDNEAAMAKQYPLLRYTKQLASKDFYKYLVLSKKVEQIAANPDPWEENTYPVTTISEVIKNLSALRAKTSNDFIKLRAAFQLVRLYRFNGQPNQLNGTYDKYIAPVKTKSWVQTAALFQKAITTGGYEGDYLLSKVFDKGGYNRTTCLVYFPSDSLQRILPYAKNNHERNVLLAMKVFNYPGRSLNYIKQIYASEPTYKELPFLLLREINKVEDWLLTNKVTSFIYPAVYGEDFGDYWDYPKDALANYQRDQVYAHELYDLLQKMIDEGKHPQKALLHLYSAHIAMLNRQYNLSSIHLQQAAAIKNLPRNVQTQIAVNRLLLHLENGMNDTTEKEFMNIINASNEKLAVHDAGIMKNQLVLYTAKKMIKQGDKARGLFLLGKTNRALGQLPISDFKTVYQEVEEGADEEVYNQMLNLFDRKKKSPFEKFICNEKISSPWNLYDYETADLKWSRTKLLDFKASWYLRQHRLLDAFNTMKGVPDSFYNKEPYSYYIGGDPFFLNIYHAHAVGEQDHRSLNKKEVVAEMLRLKNLAQKDRSKAAICYYQIANAWYNMTYYGKNWLMVKQWWSQNEIDGYNDDVERTAFNDDYFGCSYAKQWYTKAMNATKDKKLKALCFFMAQHCNENWDYYGQLVKKIEEPRYRFAINKKLAEQKGVDLKTYKEIVQECETYQSFIKQYNRTF
jgi:hypothetical protein